jgi:tetratricopeptide (TPR) repeat protein
MRTLCLAIACAITLTIGSSASAQDANDEQARRAFEAGRQAFSAGDYETALYQFRQAYELSERHELLYNIAQSLDRLRRDEETLRTLREYLERVPNTRSRSEVEARIRVLERMLAEQQQEDESERAEREQREREIAERERATEEARRRAEESQQASRPPLHPAAFITCIGLGLAGGGVAVWSGLETMSLRDSYMESDDYEEARGFYDDAQTFQTVTNVLIFSSAALGAAAIVMLFFTDWGGGPSSTEEAPAEASVIPMLTADRDGVLLGASGRF